MIKWWAQLGVPPGTKCNKVLAAVPVCYTELGCGACKDDFYISFAKS